MPRSLPLLLRTPARAAALTGGLLLALSPAGCRSAAEVVQEALPAEVPTPSLGGGTSGKAPVYLFLFTHHYLGLGGYYPDADEVRAVAEACVEADLAEHCTLFFDGLLVDKLKTRDPTLKDYVREHGFPIGYHGEESHGPYPIVVSVDHLGPARKVDEVVREGWDFDEAVNAIQYRYCHGFEGCEFGPTGYLVRPEGGETDKSVTGGIRLVRSWFGKEIGVMPGHALFQPAATFAFQNETDLKLLQGAGVFAPHFLSMTKDAALIERTEAFLGEGTTLFWYMGQLAEKGTQKTMMPMWSTESLAPRGGGAAGPNAQGYLGPHLLQFGAQALGLELPGALAQAQQRPPRGKVPPRGKRPGLPPDAPEDPADAKRGRHGGPPGAEVAQTFAALDRTVPQVVTFKIDGAKDEVHDALAWVEETTRSDRKVELVTASELHDKVKPAQVTLDADATAQAVLKYWSGGPPDFLLVDGGYASLTDAFEVMARHLAGGGKRIETTGVIAPTGRYRDRVSGSGTVTGAQVKAAAAGVVKAMDGDKYRAVPLAVTVGKTRVGFHQYLQLMAQAIAQGDGAKLTVAEAQYAPPYARFLAGKLGRENEDQTFWMETQFWTIKPVTWK